MLLQHAVVSREQLVHVVVGVEAVIADWGVGDVVCESACAHPPVDLSLCRVEEVLNFWEELLP